MADGSTAVPYRVLARKYRPTRFSELIGQDALVRTLANAFATGRIAQAFVLTGVRGVGKTTTARLIARALNCTGPDGSGGPTVDPCGVCDACVSIAEDRHVDVLEMDAASNNGVDQAREIVEAVRYRPVSARYKVYILDEVHMLSNQAFNALLKTLEEPPPHVKFIFATTEIRKVPITVRSRCQRFDLRRVEADLLAAHFGRVAEKEGAAVEAEALAMIARAADGSVRDGLSLLDQAIARAVPGPDGRMAVDAADVRDMLGLADRVRVFDLFEAVARGEAAAALAIFEDMYRLGADPVAVVNDLLDLVHWLTRARVVPATAAGDASVPEAERVRGRELAGRLALPVLARAWQMLLKGLAEASNAPNARTAVEMLLIRLAHVADLPTPGELVERLRAEGGGEPPRGGGSGGGGSGGAASAVGTGTVRGGDRQGPAMSAERPGPRLVASGGGMVGSAVPARPAAEPVAEPAVEPAIARTEPPRSFAALAELVKGQREALLYAHMTHDVRPIRYRPGFLEFQPGPAAPPTLAQELRRKLPIFTGIDWQIVVGTDAGERTLAERAQERREHVRAEAEAHPLVRAALAMFPGARIEQVREIGPVIDDDVSGDLAGDDISGDDISGDGDDDA